MLLALELAVPETYGAVRATALFLIAAHAHFQGERRGVMIALLGSAALVLGLRAARRHPGRPATCKPSTRPSSCCRAIATGLVVGSLRTAESASRLRARSLSRRTIQAEAEVRRRVAETIHDGPVQELIGLDMMLASARKAAAEGRGDDAARLLDEARELTERNIAVLRDELGGPRPVRLRGADVRDRDRELPAGLEAPLRHRGAGDDRPDRAARRDRRGPVRDRPGGGRQRRRHAGADAVSISLRTVDSAIELRVTDNGDGFGERRPAGRGRARPPRDWR